MYLNNKYILLSDICLTVHHWYKQNRHPTRCKNNGLLIIPVSSICFGQNNWYKWNRQPTRCKNNGLLIPVSSTCFGQNNCPKHVELTGIINKPLLLHLVGCLHYLYFFFFLDLLNNLNLFLYRMSCISYRYLFLVRKIFTFYLKYVLLFKCQFPRPNG